MNWDAEQECFQTLAYECSSFYRIQHDPFLVDSSEGRGDKKEGRGGEGESSRSQMESQAGASPMAGDFQVRRDFIHKEYVRVPEFDVIIISVIPGGQFDVVLPLNLSIFIKLFIIPAKPLPQPVIQRGEVNDLLVFHVG